MQEVHKVTIDLLFCLVLTLLTIHAAKSLDDSQEFSNNNLNAESAQISADKLKQDR